MENPGIQRLRQPSRSSAARLIVLLAIAFGAFITFTSSGQASTQLVIVEEKGCVYCAKFNREIGPVYPQTAEGKTAPLRRVDLQHPWPEDLKAVTPESLTPTFILVHNGKEVGRMHGYQGDEFFWFLLEELLNKLPASPSN